MVEWLKTKLIYILGILLALSIAGNVLLVTKGVNIYNTDYITTTSRSDSIANSTSLSIGYIGGDARGEWKIKTKIFNLAFSDNKKVEDFLNTLDPIQFAFAKVSWVDTIDTVTCFVQYPEITPYKSEIREGKTITKKEVRK